MPADLREALDQAAPRHVPELDFDRLWRRHRRARMRRAATAVAGGLLAVFVAVSVIQWSPTVELQPVVPSTDPFVGSWESVDLDGSFQWMTVRAPDDGSYGVDVVDESSTACGDMPATVHGTGTLAGDGRMSITQVYRCEDGTVLSEVEGVRLDQWYLIHDLGTDTLSDPTGVIWYRPGAVDSVPPPDGRATRTVETSLGTWAWTWVPEDEGATRLWDETQRRHEEDNVGVEAFWSWLADEYGTDDWEQWEADERLSEEYREWIGWHGFRRIPEAHSNGVTVIAVGKDGNLLVDAGDGYELVDRPWQRLSLFAIDLTVGPEGFVAAGLVGEGLDPGDWNPADEPPMLQRWGSADGIRWRELGPPLAVGDARGVQLSGDGHRLLLRLEGPEPSLWTSPDGVSWQRVGPDRLLAWSEQPPARTSSGWVLTNPRQTDAIRDLWACEVWVSPDAVTWVQIPFQPEVESRPLAGSGDCRVFDDNVYVRVAPGAPPPAEPGEPRVPGLWVGRLGE